MLAFITMNLLSMEAHSQTVSKEQLRGIIVQLQNLAKEGSVNLSSTTNKLHKTQLELQKVQQDADKLKQWGITQQEEATAQTKRADLEHAKALENGRERDVFVVLFAIAGAITTVSLLIPTMNRWFNLQFPWTMIAPMIAVVALFWVYFGLIRFALSKLIHIL